METTARVRQIALDVLGYPELRPGQLEAAAALADGRDCLAIEVKAASRWTERDLAGLRAFLERTPRCRAAIMAYNGEQAVRLGDKLWAVPLSTLLG